MKKQEVILTRKDSNEPFVTKQGNQYFIEGVKYTDDINILLNAIKNVKAIKYQDLHDNHKTKEEHWQAYFNFQWTEGGLILWHNPTEMWRSELSRRGKLGCPKCGGKMQMYYSPYCPICDFKGKAKKNLMQMIYFIETKYKIDTRDYAKRPTGVKDGTSYNVKHQFAWEEKNYPIIVEWSKNPIKGSRFNKEGSDFCNSKEGREFWDKVRQHYREDPEGEAKEIPYWDWWHLFCDCYSFRNDSSITINFGDIMESCREDWQKEITQLFINEFGTKDMHVLISW